MRPGRLTATRGLLGYTHAPAVNPLLEIALGYENGDLRQNVTGERRHVGRPNQHQAIGGDILAQSAPTP